MVVVVLGVLLTIVYFTCIVKRGKRKRKETSDEDVLYVSGRASHMQRLQVSDGSRLDSPKELPTHAQGKSPTFEMAQRRQKTQSRKGANKSQLQRENVSSEPTSSVAVDVEIELSETTETKQADDQRAMLCDFSAAANDPNQMDAKKGDSVTVVKTFNDGWTKVRRPDGKVGLVPTSYTIAK